MNMDKKLRHWTASASHFIGEHFDQCKHLLDKDYQGMHPLVRFVSTQLYLSCHFSTESSLILLQNGQEWDSEIINRSIIEGVVKYIYMLQGSEEEVLNKVKEYWEILPKYSSVKRSNRINLLLQELNLGERDSWKPLEDLKITELNIASIRSDTNKQQRQLLEQKWSFGNIVQGFRESEDEGLRALVHLFYNFGMSSHLTHKDGDGVAMIWERCTRERELQEVVKLAHIARAISDLCIFSEVRSKVLYQRCNEESNFIDSLRESYSLLFSELKLAKEEFRKVEIEV